MMQKKFSRTTRKKTENFYKYLIEEQKTEIERVTGENNQLIDKILVIAEKVAEKIWWWTRIQTEFIAKEVSEMIGLLPFSALINLISREYYPKKRYTQ